MTADELRYWSNELKLAWESGKVRVPVHVPGGNEEELIKIFKEIRRDDYVLSTHRNFYHAILHGISPDSMLASLAEPGGSMVHTTSVPPFLSTGIVAGGCAIGIGIAWALKELASERKVWCFVGDGVLDEGHFWEALQYADSWDLPVTFIVENNNRATCTTISQRLGHGHIRPLLRNPILREYYYEPTMPHVGSGTYVQF